MYTLFPTPQQFTPIKINNPQKIITKTGHDVEKKCIFAHD
jgi:hypothetical protein